MNNENLIQGDEVTIDGCGDEVFIYSGSNPVIGHSLRFRSNNNKWITLIPAEKYRIHKMKQPSQTVDEVIAERGKVYGDPFKSHTNIGLAWSGLLRNHGYELEHVIPASMVAQMLVIFKMLRSARVYKDDNYIDAHAYTQFADEFQKLEQNVK